MSYFEELERLADANWAAIHAASDETTRSLERARAATRHLDTPSTALIVTGSAGRGEMTGGSDFDWLLLVDGSSDPEHHILMLEIQKQLKIAGLNDPAKGGVFGSLISSHDLVHRVAGASDTNENLTRRILLLLESQAVFGDTIRSRVLRNILARYIVHDRPISRSATPHFLLNDVIRYWRSRPTFPRRCGNAVAKDGESGT